MLVFMFQDVPQQPQTVQKLHPNYQLLVNSQKQVTQIPTIRNIPIAVTNHFLQALPNKHMTRTITPNVPTVNNPLMRLNQIPMPSAMSPLSLNIASPMYSLPSSPNTPNYSPAISPAQMDHMLSPYSTPQSLSPVGKYNQVRSPGSRLLSPAGVIQGCDPYLSNKMQPSPTFQIQNDLLLEFNLPMTPDTWSESEVLQTSDLLTAFDDVKLD